MKRCTRRGFFRHGIETGLALGTMRSLVGCAPPTPVQPVNEMARVITVRGGDLRRMTLEILEAIGGIETVVHPGETVFIKPNLATAGLVNHDPIPTGDCSKPEIALTVAEECLKAGAAEVIIGDATQVPRFSWDELRTLDGTTNYTAEALRLSDTYPGRVTLACLMSDSPAWDAVPAPYSGLGEIRISSLVARADRVISIPVIKTHRWTKVTASMKNFVGVTSTNDYGLGMPWRFMLHNAPGGIEGCFLDIVNAVRPDLAIIDGSICCEGNGPHVLPGWWGTTVDMRDRLGDWLLLASRDYVAADATAARVIGQEAMNVKHIRTAWEMGLGQAESGMIEVDGASLSELQVEWLAAEPTDGFLDVLVPGAMMLYGP